MRESAAGGTWKEFRLNQAMRGERGRAKEERGAKRTLGNQETEMAELCRYQKVGEEKWKPSPCKEEV